MQRSLHEGWTVHAVGGPAPDEVAGRRITAIVPGCVHLDLMAAGLIPDPYLDENEAVVAWVGHVDWRYETSFDWDGSDDPQIDLVADGLDTVATIELNGTVVAETANMHRSYRFDVASLLRPGRNELAVTFASAVVSAQRFSEQLGPRPHVNTMPYNALRKMACNLGWDWGPILVTAGIWKPLLLESWQTARISSVRPLVDVVGTTGVLTAHVGLQREPGQDQPLTVRATVAGVVSEVLVGAGECTAVVEVLVPDVTRWWPHGYGDQPLYDVAVTVLDTAAGWAGRVGFRTVSVLSEPDEHGTPFTFTINGSPLFARGVNWIPDDCFPSRISRTRYSDRLLQAKAGNVNLVRVWGGGLYESDDFYDLCDELGILVWQDFLLACAAYAEEEPLRGEIVAEAREAVTRLSPHPSLVLWNGANENLWGHEDWGWKDILGDKTWGLGYYQDVFPSIVAELDPSRPYSPGSPFSPSADLHPNNPAHGTMHIWDVWNEKDYGHYRSYTPRFVSEFGWEGPPTWSTLTGAIHDDPLGPESPGVVAHQKAANGVVKLAKGLHGHFAEPANTDDWHWAASLNQARALTTGIEHLRSLMPVCMGTVWWQLNDCWPVTSWAVVDGDGKRKPAWYAMRRSYRDRLLTLQPRDGGLALVLVNDTDEAWADVVRVARISFDGRPLREVTHQVAAAARAAVTVALEDEIATPEDAAREVVLASCGSERAWWHFCEDVDADLPEPKLDVTVVGVADGYRVVVASSTFVRDVALLADRVAPDAVVDEMLVTLLPGEATSIHVRTAATLMPAQLTDPWVLRSANQLAGAPQPQL